jgi:GNAT superfamily N-acetyltransferase
MVDIELREARMTDAAALATLVTELGYASQPSEMRERLAGLLSDSNYAAFVAEKGSQVLGLGGGALGRYFEKNGSYARLVVLVVSEAARGLGIGRALVDAVERWARTRGAQELFVNSGSHRQEAHRFYEQCGFRVTGVRLAKSAIPPV